MLNGLRRTLIGAVAFAAIFVGPTQAKAAIIIEGQPDLNRDLFAVQGFSEIVARGEMSGSLEKIKVQLYFASDTNLARPSDFALVIYDENRLVSNYLSDVKYDTAASTAKYRGLDGSSTELFDFSSAGYQTWGGAGAGGTVILDTGGDITLVNTITDASTVSIAIAFGWVGSTESEAGLVSTNASATYGSSSFVTGDSSNTTQPGRITFSGTNLAAAGSTGAVPEPASYLLCVIAGVGGIATRRRGRK